jgi:hypothetical protein
MLERRTPNTYRKGNPNNRRLFLLRKEKIENFIKSYSIEIESALVTFHGREERANSLHPPPPHPPQVKILSAGGGALKSVMDASMG